MTTTTEHTVWDLARMAEVHSPDSEDSPGAKWLRVVETYAADVSLGQYWEDAISETADSVVPIYTYNRWQVFVDLCAYEEDISELGAGVEDLTEAAGVALYMVAERLVRALVEDRIEASGVEEDDDDE